MCACSCFYSHPELVKGIFDPDDSTEPSDSEGEDDRELQEIYDHIDELHEV